MKQNDIKDITNKLSPQNMENIFNVYLDEDTQYYFYNIIKTINFPDDIKREYYTLHTVEYNETWPKISWKYYKNVKLWWIICCLNKINNPTKNPIAGTVLKILIPSMVKTILNKLKEN